MKKWLCGAMLFALVVVARSQPEFYSDAFLGLPEFRALPVRLPTADPDSVQLEVHVRIVNDDLQFIRLNGRYQARYGLDISIRRDEDDLVAYDHHERTITVATYAETNSRLKADQTVSVFTLTPDEYTLKIDLVDRETRKNRAIEKKVEFPAENWSQDFRLGDIVSLDSTKSPLLTGGVIQQQPLRIAYKLYAESPQGLGLFYNLQDEGGTVIDKRAVIPSGVGPLYADTIQVTLDTLQHGNYQFILVARRGDVTLTRGYAFTLLRKDLPGFISNLDLAIKQLKYVATDEEYRKLMKARPSQKEELFREFWAKKDPTPGTPTNEKMEEYYRRIRFANEQFSGYRDGWETDMGMVYIIYGAPSEIERHPFDISTKPYEVWYYYDINRKFIFQDVEGFGEYRLVSPLWRNY
jgi:GWxTD domain-containing protein